MSNKPNNPSAFPSTEIPNEGSFDPGMTLRDYFAAKAIQNHPMNGHHITEIAEYAYGLADAMLKQREL